MSYDKELADRIRALVEDEPGLTERKMFGGLASLVNGNIAVAASSTDGIMVRVDPARSEALLADGSATRMVMNGREMNGWLRVAPDNLGTEKDLERWVAIGVAYARSLPAK